MANEFRIKNGLIVSGSADFEQDLRVRGTLTVDELHTSITTSSIIYESGSTRFGNSIDDIHTLTGSVNITGSISLNGQAIGTGKLDETTFNAFTASHNTTNTEFGNLTSSYNSFTSSYITNSGSFNTRVSNLESFSSSLDAAFVNEVEFGSFSSSVKTYQSNLNTYTGSLENRLYGIEGTTGSLNTFTASVNGLINTATSSLSSSVATTNLSQNNRLDSLELKTGSYATTGSNTFKGLQLVSGSILPTDDNAYDLGSPTYQWRDVYISSGSLYIDGSKVLSSTTQELTITTDNGQSIKILEGTTDNITLQTADGNIELKSSAAGDILIDPTNGKILLKGTVEVLNGQKIQSSVNGTPVVFANDIVVSGSVVLTGTIDGVDLSVFETNTNNRLNSLETSTGSLNIFTSSTAGRLTSIETSTSSLNSFSTSTNTRLNSLESTTASINTFTSSINTTINNIINNGTLVSGSSQIMITGTTGYSTFSSSIDTSITTLSSSVAVTTNGLSSSIATTDLGQNNRLNSLEGKTGSYATTGSNSFLGTQNITGSVIISQDLTVLGSSSFLYVTSSQLAVSSSTISVNVFEPAERFGGLKVYDSGSSNATASLLWDSLNNRWVYQNASGSNYSGAMLIMGPRNTGSLGDETTLTNGKIPKSIGGDHIGDSIISESGGGIGISGSLVITGSLSASGTVYGTNITAIETTTSSLNSYTSSTNTKLGVIEGTTSSLNTYTSSNNTRLNGIETATSSLNSFTSSINTTIKSKLNSDGVISGSSQITFGSISGVPSGLVSGSSQITYGSISGIPSGIVSGSSQISFGGISGVPGGLVSGSSQIDLTATTNYASGIKTRLDAVGVVSGSAQVTNIANSQLTNSSFYVGTTSISLGRASASQTLTGVSIDGNAGTATSAGVIATPTYNNGTTFNTLFTGLTSNTSKTYIIYNSTDQPLGTGLYNVIMHKFDANYGSYMAMNTEPNTGNLYLKQLYNGTWGSWRTVLDSSNYTSYAMQGAGYSANQNLNTGSTPTFSSIYSSSSGGFYLGDTGAGVYRDNTYDVVLVQNNASGNPLYMAGAGDVIVSIDSNNNETNRKFIVGNNAVKASNELFSVNESGITYSSGGFQSASSTLNLLGGQIYVSAVNSNTLNSGYANADNNSDIWINYRGYSDAQSYYRNFNVGDGRGANIMWAQGSSRRVSINNGQVASYTLHVNGDGYFASTLTVAGTIQPDANGTRDLGTSSLRWSTVYTSDLSMSNGIGDYTIVEGLEDLFLYNNKTNKVFKFMLQEVDPSTATPKKS